MLSKYRPLMELDSIGRETVASSITIVISFFKMITISYRIWLSTVYTMHAQNALKYPHLSLIASKDFQYKCRMTYLAPSRHSCMNSMRPCYSHRHFPSLPKTTWQVSRPRLVTKSPCLLMCEKHLLKGTNLQRLRKLKLEYVYTWFRELEKSVLSFTRKSTIFPWLDSKTNRVSFLIVFLTQSLTLSMKICPSLSETSMCANS